MPKHRLIFASANAICALPEEADRGCGRPLPFDNAKLASGVTQVRDVKLARRRFCVNFAVGGEKREEKSVEDLLEKRRGNEIRLEPGRFHTAN
ncbi:MAG TPA: hypothetical protein VMS87_01130 [Roseiarcus sp.]|nr:hypothetical protein [Roseiarcus sp.]